MPAAAQPLHLLVPNAVPATPAHGTDDDGAAAVLGALLARLQPAGTLRLPGDSPATPFEAALARALHLPGEAGRWPWAALDTATIGAACAWLRPCHWQLGLDHVTLLNPADVALTEAESHALLATVQPLLAEDGIALHYHRPDAWLAQGALFDGLTTCSMARALQAPVTRDVLAAAPTEAQGAHLRRLQTELQMLLYHHPVNEAREAQRQWPVNAVWIDGAGTLHAPLAPAPQVVVDRHLADLPPHATAAERQAAWHALAHAGLAQLVQALDAGQPVQLTLCGPRAAITLQSGRSWGFRISSLFKPQRWLDLRQQL
jgi:hypothetical protein